MPLFSTQMGWRGIDTTVAVELLIIVALGFAVVGYVGWSSDAVVAEFMSATKSSASDQSGTGPSGCPVGKRKLPTQLPTTPP
jgi:hypothetical protein